MSGIRRSCAALRIYGDALVPSEISQMLGCEPSLAHAKGEKLRQDRNGNPRIARSGMWRLLAEDSEPEDLNAQIDDILGRLTADLNIWKAIGNRFRVDMFCGLFMASGNDGMVLIPQILSALGQRGILVQLDIYEPDEPEVEVPPPASGLAIIIREQPYRSYLDEKYFFTWLESLDDVIGVHGTPDGLRIDLRDRYLSKGGALDLIALFTRYGYPLAPIVPFLNPEHDDYFRDRAAHWYNEIYGS